AEDIPDDEWDLVFGVNVKGTLYTNQAAFRHLKEGGGVIINFGSGAGIRGQRGSAHYSASKGAVMSWTRTVAQEWSKYGIRVNSVVPAIWTQMYDEYRSRMSDQERMIHDMAMQHVIPLGGKLGDPDRDAAPVMVFLASDLSHFMTGQCFAVDGEALSGHEVRQIAGEEDHHRAGVGVGVAELAAEWDDVLHRHVVDHAF